ncbi:MAG: FAD-dependent oxidoreductase [Burkholderiales bacterium]|nr:FAD-dependent oxidoreductase [Burkholderiales bacterium]
MEKQNVIDVVIIGGGLVGATFAIDLAQKNPKLNIVIIEKKSIEANSIDANRVYAISPQNVNYLSELHIWPEALAGTINYMDVYGDGNGNIKLDAQTANTLFLAKTIAAKDLYANILAKLSQLMNVKQVYDNLSDMVFHKNNIELIGNHRYFCSLVVGSDGANSWVRTKADIKFESKDYHQYGVVANFTSQFKHKNTAYQWFNQGEVLALLPLKNDQISIVYSCYNYEHILKLNATEFENLIEQKLSLKLGKLKLSSKVDAFPLKMNTANKIYANRILLLGDAAHTIHPLAGQGVNIGFSDAQHLVKVLAKCKNYQLADKAILIAYNNNRIPRIKNMQLICNSLYELFATKNQIAIAARNLGLNFVNSNKILKKIIINKTTNE